MFTHLPSKNFEEMRPLYSFLPHIDQGKKGGEERGGRLIFLISGFADLHDI